MLLPVLCVCRFLPTECDDWIKVIDPEEAGANELETASKSAGANDSLLSLAAWQPSWDSAAMAQAMLGMLPFHIAMLYKRVSSC